ncbi:MAG: UDP-N-acetylmuramoyl-L-alanine--D-glutamate ligase [Pseudomonadota bacterium]
MIDLASFSKSLKHKKVAVYGLGLSGLSAVKALVAANIRVVTDDSNQQQCNKAKELGAQVADLESSLDQSFDFLLLSPGVPLTHPEPHAVVKKAHEENVEIIGDVELLSRSGQMPKTVGITGTNGKSTTTALMAHALNENAYRAVAAGNIGTPVLDLNLDDVDILVLELSSYQLDLCPTYRPDISILLNITPDHLDRHGDMEGYIKAKARILDHANIKIVGVDTKVIKDLSENSITISGEGHEADIKVFNQILYDSDIKISDVGHYDRLKGSHNHQNLAAVYAVAKELGIEKKGILKSFETYQGLPHRQYRVRTINNVDYVNDSKATNVESAARALSSYNHTFWVAGGRSKEGGLNGLEGYISHIQKAYLIGEAAEDFAVWCQDNDVEYEITHILNKAIERAHEDAQDFKKGCVLLAPACASWDQFRSFEERGDAFVERVMRFEGSP